MLGFPMTTCAPLFAVMPVLQRAMLLTPGSEILTAAQTNHLLLQFFKKYHYFTRVYKGKEK